MANSEESRENPNEERSSKEKMLKTLKDPNFWLNNIILIALLIFAVYAQINGMYIQKETRVIETCNGQIMGWDNYIGGKYIERINITNTSDIGIRDANNITNLMRIALK